MKNYFPHEYNARNDRKLKLVRSKFGAIGKELYWDIVEMLYCEDGYLPIIDIPIIANDYGVAPEFINALLDLEIGNNKTLFQRNETHFWSDSVLTRIAFIKEKSEKNRRNARKRWDEEELEEIPEVPEAPEVPVGEPPKPPKKGKSKSEYIKLPEIEYVNLTEDDLKKLSEKYGERKIMKAIENLDTWLAKGTKKAVEVRKKPHKAHFRADSWVWEGVAEALKKEKAQEPIKPDLEKIKKEKEQRESIKRQMDMKESVCDKKTAINYIVEYYGASESALKISSVFKEYAKEYGITLDEVVKAGKNKKTGEDE